MEDVAVAYGFNNLKMTLPATNTIAAPLPLNKLSDAIRHEMAQMGFTEALSLILVFVPYNSSAPTTKITKTSANPITKKQLPSLIRKPLNIKSSAHPLLPGLLKTVSCNKDLPLPIEIFEVYPSITPGL